MRFAPNMDRKLSAIDLEQPSFAQQTPAAAPDQDSAVDRKDSGELALQKFALALPEPDARPAKAQAILEPQDRHSCASCNQEFDSRLALSIHVGRVHKECVSAGVGGGHASNVGDPNSTANKRNHTCHLCDKAFYSASYLSQHLRIHSGLKPYGCQVCSRRFTQLSHLQQHRRTHTGERPYKCKQPGCSKAFSQLSNLQSHSRSHMTDRTYKCTSCYKCFLDKESLCSHVSTHLGTRRARAFSCHVCDKSYTQDTYLQNHIKVKHSGLTVTSDKTMAHATSIRHHNQQQQQKQQQLLLSEAKGADSELLPSGGSEAPRQTHAAKLLRHHSQHTSPHLQHQLLQRHDLPISSLMLASLGLTATATATTAAVDRGFLLREQQPPSGSRCDGGNSSGDGVRPSLVFPPAMNALPLSMSASSERAVTAVPAETCLHRSPLNSSSHRATTPAVLPLVAPGAQDLLLSTISEKGQVASVGSTVFDQVGGCSMKSSASRSPMDTASHLTALGESCKVDPSWQFGGPGGGGGGVGDCGCPNYCSSYMQADLHALQMSLSQHEPCRWPSCSAELDHHGFGFAPSSGNSGRLLANPAVGPPYWLCSDNAYKPSGVLSRGLFGGSNGSLIDGIGGAMSPYGFAVTQSVASVEPFVHADLMSLSKVPGHSGFGNVHFPGL